MAQSLKLFLCAQVADKLVALEMENMGHMEKGNMDKALESIKQEITLIQGAFREPHQLPVTIRNTFQVQNYRL